MTELRKSIYNINESVETNNNTKRRCCSVGMIKYIGGVIFCMGVSGISFYLGTVWDKYHLENNDGSL